MKKRELFYFLCMFILILFVASILSYATGNVASIKVQKRIDSLRMIPDGCYNIIYNGPPEQKINIYFYESGLNSNMKGFDSFVNGSYGFLFGNSTFAGVEPYKSLKSKFNVYSFKDSSDTSIEGSCPGAQTCGYGYIKEKLSLCKDFSAPTDWGLSNGNYNIIIIPTEDRSSYSSTGRIIMNIKGMPAYSSQDLIFIQLYSFEPSILMHELGHKIGFLGEEYAYLDLEYYSPNIDSAECKKWCGGVDTSSVCYQQYSGWLECFEDKFVDTLPEIQSILSENNLDYNSVGVDWFGKCFSKSYASSCGSRVKGILSGLGIAQQGNSWNSDWNYCKQNFPNIYGHSACNLGSQCNKVITRSAQKRSKSILGCYAQNNLAGFLPTPENSFVMGGLFSYTNRTSYGSYNERIVRNNILRRTRYIT